LAVQVATNYSNDYSDGKRGTDKNRVGPLRLVGSGLVPPSRVKMAAFLAFGVAAAAGLALAAATTWWLLPVGAACFAGGWFYTGGPKPYGYIGLGELFVLVFFGVVAVLGTVYVEVGTFPAAAIVTSLGLGSVATALLEANNLRDIDTDIESSKRTLAVRLGRSRAGWLYVGSIAAALVSVGIVAIWHPLALIGLLAAPLAISPFRLVLGGAQGRDLLPVLGGTARFQLAIGALLVVGFVL
jgi:1,4-dihydroxy-2-naphthoate octaprenyltransferase